MNSSRDVSLFLIQGLAAKSRRTYTAGQRQFEQFIQTLAAVSHHGPTLQVFESQLVLFVSWLSGTLSPATVGSILQRFNIIWLCAAQHPALPLCGQMAVRLQHLKSGYSRQFFFLQLPQWCCHGSRGSRPPSSSHPRS